MPIDESLRITLPAAIPISNNQIAARNFELALSVFNNGAYVLSRLQYMTYSPGHLPVQVWLYAGGVEYSRISGVNGQIAITLDVTTFATERIIIYNLSHLAEAHFTLHFRGWLYGEQIQ